jgi:hypothetical protein
MTRVSIVGANIRSDNSYEVLILYESKFFILLRKLFEKAQFDSEVSVWVDNGMFGPITRGLHRMRFYKRLPDHFRCSNTGCVDCRRKFGYELLGLCRNEVLPPLPSSRNTAHKLPS